MNYCRLLVLGVLLIKGDPVAHAWSEQVVAFAGGNVILPCSLKTSRADDLQTLDWSKKGLGPGVVLLYRDSCENFEMKHVDFEYRTSLIMREMNNGNISLRISNVKLSDAGTYWCKAFLKNKTTETTTVELDVVAVSDPKLTVVSVDTRGVTVECKARCWLPFPEMKILDNEGNNVAAEDPQEEQKSEGCFTVKLSVTLQNPTSRVVCTVHQQATKQNRTAEILIPGFWMGSTSIISMSVGLTALFFMAVIAIILWSRKRSSKSGMRKQSNSSTTSSSESYPMLPNESGLSTGAENTVNSNKKNHRNSSPASVCALQKNHRNSTSAFGCSLQKNHRNSSPALETSASSGSTENKCSVVHFRSESDPLSYFDQNTVLQHRSSSGLPRSSSSYNTFLPPAEH